MKKRSRFIAGLLSVILAAQPVGIYGQEELTQRDNEAMWQQEAAGQLKEDGFSTDPEAGNFGVSEDMISANVSAENEGSKYAGTEFAFSADEDAEGMIPENGTSAQGFTDGESSIPGEEPEENGFLDDVNLAEAQDTLNEVQNPESYMTDEVEAPIKAADELASGISFFSIGYYNGSYGEQLGDESANLYGRMVERYVTNYRTGLADADYAELAVSLLDRIYFDASVGDDGKLVQDDNFAAARAELKYIVQAAVDAFSYDHPEVFWFRGCTYTFSYGYTKNADGNCQGYISNSVKLQMGTKEIETDAHKDMEAFMASVDNTVSILQGELGNASTPEKVKGIHDYICRLATYKGADAPGNLVVHSARPAFLGTDHGFVCEGYAKTMKILCDRLGVNCACVSGLAKSTAYGTVGAHMWNYIQMADGKWYLVDATWDDTKDPEVPLTTYLMVGWDSQGLYIKISEERTENRDLSASGGMQFTFPQLERGIYHSWTLNQTEIAPTCTEAGRGAYRCILCGETKTDAIPAAGHQLTKIEAKASTCTVQGNGEYWKCTRCGKLFSDAQGTKETTEAAMKLPLASHSYGEYKTTKAATALAEGVKTAVCSNCGAAVTAPIARLTPAVKLSVSSLTLKVRQSFTIKASGLASGDKVTKWKSSNTKVATVNSKGKVIARKKGSATITVTLASGLSKKIKVKVQNGTVKTTKIKINTRQVTLAKKGKTYTLTATVSPVTSQQKVTYTSSNPKVATVNSKGKITAKRKGTTVITVRSGSKKITCKVTVKK
ncbi:Ig-like domain-containing protein [Ruminococcus sp. 5_1_39BFAA]|uniref:Ig-like domain-containing protein n=1 Tax=Ruminococcus sp. 5_1_39BFAA TaxID=457412 RepID=UPI00356761E4